MMTKTTMSALRALQLIANDESRGFVSVRTIADQISESPTYTAKTVGALVKAGILRAEKGSRGGVRLNRHSEQITLLDVVRACQGEVVGDHCGHDYPLEVACSYHRASMELHDAITQVLGRWTLAQLMKRPFSLHAGAVPCKMHNQQQAAPVQVLRAPVGDDK